MEAASDADHIPGIKKEGTRKSSGIVYLSNTKHFWKYLAEYGLCLIDQKCVT